MAVALQDTRAKEFKGCISEKFYRFTPKHTACVARSQYAIKSGVYGDEKQLIVMQHNLLRSKENATNMQKMAWDDELASVAQRWTDNCKFSHDKVSNIPGGVTAGQNLAAGYSTWSAVVKGWYHERSLFTYGLQRANTFQKVGDFTQFMWATSSRIGCGFTFCKNMAYKRFYVCNYGPAGNGGDWSKPFKAGKRCSDCPDSCKNDICDCGGKVCKNGGVLDINTCKCKCSKPWQLPEDCSLNCSAVVENSSCKPGGFYHGKCLTFSNVPSECPISCNVCPYSDDKLKTDVTSGLTTVTVTDEVTIPLAAPRH